MNIKVLFTTIIISLFTTSLSAKNVCTAKSFDGLNVYIEKSFAMKTKAQNLYDKKVKQFTDLNIQLFTKTGATFDQVKDFYIQAEPEVLMALRHQEDFTKKWSDDFGVVGTNLSSCVSRLKKVSKTLKKLNSSCKEYGHTEGIASSQKNIGIVKEVLKECQLLKKKYIKINNQVVEEFQLLHNARRRAESEKRK